MVHQKLEGLLFQNAPLLLHVLFKLKVFLFYCGVFKILLNLLQFPSGYSDCIYLVVPEARVYGWMGYDGWMGWTEYQKRLLIILTL